MGQAILYCVRCSTQLRDSHFEQGKAYRIDNFAVCAACGPEAAKSLPPESVPKLFDAIAGRDRKPAAVSQRKSGTALPALRESSRSLNPLTGSSTATPQIPKKPMNPWILVGIVAAVLVVLVAVLVAGQGGKTDPAALSPAPAAPSSGPAVRPPAADAPAQAALKKAALYAEENPGDLDGQIRLYSDLVLLGDRGLAGAEARRKVEALRARDQEAVRQALSALNQEIDPVEKAGQFAEAIRMAEAAKFRLTSTAWQLAVEKRASDLRAALAEAKKPPPPPPLPPPPPPPDPAKRSAEAKAYDAAWTKAMAKASTRDYLGAAADLKKDAAALKDEKDDDVRREAAQDIADLENLDKVYKASIAAAAGTRSIDLKVASGRVLGSNADRVELFLEPKKPTVFVEWLDVHADAMVPLLKMQATDPRLPLLFAVLDGGAELIEGLAAKYASYKGTPSRAPEGEAPARELFYAAERDWRSMESREKSVEAYRALRTKYKDSTVVKHEQARIDRRSEAGREYYFLAPDFSFAGSFAPYKEERIESIADSEASQTLRNWAELGYAPFPGQTYRAWVLVGGCCAETFTFYYQATGLTEVNPKTKKKEPAEPGGTAAVPQKPPVKGLKPTHPKGEPKKPTRWEWMEVATPRVSAPGTRRLRFLTDQRGFAIAAVVVSATRSKPPGEAEMAELARTRALDATPGWALDRPGNSPRVLVDDFEDGKSGWVWVGGWEFPGAAGGYSIDPTAGRDGKAAGKFVADFTAGGVYVGGWRDLARLPSRSFKEIRLWVKGPTLTGLGIRLADSSDQLHQSHITVTPSPEWQEIVLVISKLAGGEHWGGANDGVWHGPIKGFGINIGKDSFAAGGKKGDVWIDDVEGILDPDAPDK